MITEVYIFIVLIISSFLQTVTGFGYAIVTAPLLALVLGAKETVMLVMLTGLLIRFLLIGATRNEGSFKAIFPLISASIIGAIPGAYIMTIISGEMLKVFIGIVLLAAAIALWKKHTVVVKHHKATEAAVGAISGFLATTTSINGPPVVLYYMNSGADENKAEFRGNLTRYFFLINIASILMSIVAGTLKFQEIWFYTLISVPAAYIGFFMGQKLFYRINAETFRKASLIMIFASSIIIMGAELLKFLSQLC